MMHWHLNWYLGEMFDFWTTVITSECTPDMENWLHAQFGSYSRDRPSGNFYVRHVIASATPKYRWHIKSSEIATVFALKYG